MWDEADPYLEEECHELAAVLETPPGVPFERRAQFRRFGELRAQLKQPAANPHGIAKAALAASTKSEHVRVLRLVQEAPSSYDTLAVATALLEILSQARRKHQWKWSTTSKKGAAIQGALKLLPLYVRAESIALSDYPEWTQGMKTLNAKAKEESPRAVTPVTLAQITEAVTKAPTAELKSILIVAWLCAARIGDLLQLHVDDLTWDASRRCLAVTYRRGKTIKVRGPYTLQTEVPERWAEIVSTYLKDQKGRVWSVTVAAVCSVLRSVDPTLECRGIRRGSLQLMARNDVPEEVLLLFSGHTTLNMLRRYLAWGLVGSRKESTMMSASRKLVGGGFHISPEERRPHFLNCLGHEAPSSTEFRRMDGKEQFRGKNTLPLHSKPVTGSVDLQRIRSWRLPKMLRRLVLENLRWLDDKTIYRQFLSNGTARTQSSIRYSPKDIDTMLRTGKLRVACPPLEFGGARGFTVVEADKHRRRPILEPFLNDLFKQVPTVRFAPLEHRRRQIATSKYAATFDFASWYDQLGLDRKVGAFFAAKAGNKWLAPTTLPMGFRPSCATAQCVTWAIVHGIESGTTCRVITYIDNVIILGQSKTRCTRSLNVFWLARTKPEQC